MSPDSPNDKSRHSMLCITQEVQLLEKYREDKIAFSLVDGERVGNASCGGEPVKLDLGREW